MRTKILCLACALGLVPSFVASAFAGVENVDRLVDEYLQQLGAEDYFVTPVTNPFVARTFPNTAFSGVYFQQYPDEVAPPQGLSEANVFYMDKASGQINYLTGPDDLRNFFQVSWNPVVRGTAPTGLLEDATKTWLRLSQEFSQDGFYQFSKPVVAVAGNTAHGVVTVAQGGRGHISVTLTIGPTGALSIEEERHIHPGVRPI